MNAVNLKPIGRLGNQLFQYAHARAYADRHGFELRIGPWIGDSLFNLSHPPIQCEFPGRYETEIKPGECGFTFGGYAQQQSCMIYTKAQVKQWFAPNARFQSVIDSVEARELTGHLRRGDYLESGYPLVSEASYINACREHGLDESKLVFVSDSKPRLCSWPGLEYLEDFSVLLKSKTMLRGNSSFSWWASTLGDARTFAPVIDGLTGGKEHDVKFVEGNWPRIADIGFVTELHLNV